MWWVGDQKGEERLDSDFVVESSEADIRRRFNSMA